MTIKIKLKGIDEELARIKKEQDKEIHSQLLRHSKALRGALARETPKDTGKASQGWTIVDNKKSVSVVNKVEYIVALNAGHSKQAASYFVERVALQFGKPRGIIANIT